MCYCRMHTQKRGHSCVISLVCHITFSSQLNSSVWFILMTDSSAWRIWSFCTESRRAALLLCCSVFLFRRPKDWSQAAYLARFHFSLLQKLLGDSGSVVCGCWNIPLLWSFRRLKSSCQTLSWSSTGPHDPLGHSSLVLTHSQLHAGLRLRRTRVSQNYSGFYSCFSSIL